MNDALTYTNAFSEMLAPLLEFIRVTGFFEAFIFMPLMTIAAVILFIQLRLIIQKNNTFNDTTRARFPKLWQFSYFTLCFIVTNSTAVAFKTMIFEETDYDSFVWYLPWVSPLHFYISSIAGGMLWLIWRNRSSWLDKTICIYVQLGFFGGYWVAAYRLFNEPFELTDPTSGFSGVFLAFWFGLLNWDLAIRYFKAPYESLNKKETLKFSQPHKYGS